MAHSCRVQHRWTEQIILYIGILPYSHLKINKKYKRKNEQPKGYPQKDKYD